jgi:hypothetical protein
MRHVFAVLLVFTRCLLAAGSNTCSELTTITEADGTTGVISDGPDNYGELWADFSRSTRK